ncbi:MAG TPA: hypothetical protein PKA28_11015 [Methylomusa anaerophila]|uniref:Uncharacterized protein n=1 Tax=Methylomusa anaerophila TaxID=1930071 RepID=A0A348AJ41_9FIRM|nr:hypothetical protein [Methylomusa anaerophila]BBB91089.1 hypothetical protein MAMMFC1_01757 [Methylomusa anaerophila]HML88966.1 hypothetical protein [Methylomusa anaerophila]
MLAFNSDGLLPPGDYPMTLDVLKQSLLVVGPPDTPNWNRRWRHLLVCNLEILCKQLFHVQDLYPGKISNIYIDGSFVEDKENPNDIDGYFECDYKFFATRQLQDELNRLDPHKTWTWNNESRRSHYISTKKQLPN